MFLGEGVRGEVFVMGGQGGFKRVPESYDGLIQMLDVLYEEVDGCSFYEYLFPDNERQGEMPDDYSKPNAVYLYQSDSTAEYRDRKMQRRIMLSDTWEEDFYEYVAGNYLTLCSGLSYRGWSNRLQDAQRMNALVFDLDGVGVRELRNLQVRFGESPYYVGSLPMPTFLVASGGGLHLYYVFEQPVDLYPNIKLQLKSLKHDFTFRMWDPGDTSTQEEIQYQSINQAFRMVGSINGKYGNVIRAYRTGDKITLDLLNQYARPENQVDVNKPFRPSKMTREQAKESYPEWYQRVVVEKKKRLKKWDIKGKQGYALYEWWLKRIGEVKGGHRYYFMMCMVIYACKCDVPREKLEKDLEMAYEKLQLVQHDNPLTKEDVRSALETYDKEYYNFTIADIEKLTDIHIERNKRNYQKQKDHLEEARAIRDIRMRRQNKDWRENNGRPSEENTIREYLRVHPDASKAEVIKATGKAKNTVRKYYDRIKLEQITDLKAKEDYRRSVQQDRERRENAEAVVMEYLLQHPNARKVDVIRATGLSKPTVYKYYNAARKQPITT